MINNIPQPIKNRDYYLGEYDYETCWEKGGSGKFGDYNCDSSLELVKSAMNFVKTHSGKLGSDVKFILWTGQVIKSKKVAWLEFLTLRIWIDFRFLGMIPLMQRMNILTKI